MNDSTKSTKSEDWQTIPGEITFENMIKLIEISLVKKEQEFKSLYDDVSDLIHNITAHNLTPASKLKTFCKKWKIDAPVK